MGPGPGDHQTQLNTTPKWPGCCKISHELREHLHNTFLLCIQRARPRHDVTVANTSHPCSEYLFSRWIQVGDEANDNRAMLEISYPVDKGIVKDWDDMVHLWDYTLKKMEVRVSLP